MREFLRRRYTDEFSENEPVASARFTLDDDERAALEVLSPLAKDATTATVTRYYSTPTRWTSGA